jgi:RNA polymerase sigma-70 factor (ECF subfamily)
VTGADPETRQAGPDAQPTKPFHWSPGEHARLVRLCAAIVRDATAAEDLAQETLLEAWRHRDKLVDPTGANRWLNAIARNVCRRWLSSRSRAPHPVPEIAGGASCCDDVEVALEREELVELLDRALALLPPATRDALVAHYIEQHSHAEIAARLGTTADAVSMRLSRGKLRLRYLLETTFADEAVAEGWVRRGQTGWRQTRLRCVDCGRAAVELRRSTREATVAFRCTTCGPDTLSVRLPLDTPVFADLVGGLQRPSAILARTADWSLGYWSPSERSGWAACVRCGRRQQVLPYTRPAGTTWSARHGWYVDCDGCGEQTSGSLAGIALALPAVRSALHRQPRLRALPVREVERDGQRAMVVGFAGTGGAEEAAAVFCRDTYRLLHVAGPALP